MIRRKAATSARRRNFAAQAMSYLRKLRDQTRETANLAVVDDESIIVLIRAESREIMRSLTKVGGRVAMVASGVLRCVAAVVYSDHSEPLAAISVSGMTSRVTDERLPLLGRMVRDVATELALALGGVLPPAQRA